MVAKIKQKLSVSPNIARRMRELRPASIYRYAFRHKRFSPAVTSLPFDASLEQILDWLVGMETIEANLPTRRSCIKEIMKFVQRCGMDTHYTECVGQPILWATSRPGATRPKVLLAAHLDVVPGPEHLFHMKQVNDAYVGRGVLDMKCAVAAYLSVIRELKDQLQELDFGLLLTTDEEISGKDGVNSVEKMVADGYAADFVLLPDSTQDWNMEQSAKGFLQFTLSSAGQAGHGSRPWEGENALYKLVDVIAALKQQYVNAGPGDTTLNVGIISGGEAPNRIPSLATAEIEFRPTTLGELERLQESIPAFCHDYGVVATLRTRIDPTTHNFSDPHMTAFMDVVERVRGVRPQPFASYGGSDARFFLQRDIPVAVFYPTGGGHHGDNEWMEQKSLAQLAEVTKIYLQAACRVN